MILHDEAYYERRRPIEDLGPVKNCLRFIWDKKRRAFLDRTAKDWAYVGLFYFWFFGILLSIFSLQLFITLKVIGESDRPYIQHRANSDLNEGRYIFRQPRFSTPGLGMVPNIQASNVPLISLSSENPQNTKSQKYIEAINNFLNDYNRNISNYNLECDKQVLSNVTRSKPCYFDIKTLGNCSQIPYGYSEPYQPCVYIKFNKRFDWIPVHYNRSSMLPKRMPKELKKIIKITEKPYVWISCDGAENFDKEHIGIIEYLPQRGFPVYYFPFKERKQYLSPIVALVFKNLTANRFITIECYAWAQNIDEQMYTTLDFQIFID